MTKVITFSRAFQAKHPKAGQPTYFVEKIWKHLWDTEKTSMNPLRDYQPTHDAMFHPDGVGVVNIHTFAPKLHTIRNGNRWKAGDIFSPRVWTGLPRKSKQIEFAPELEVKKVYSFTKDLISTDFLLNGKPVPPTLLQSIATNDGLTLDDFLFWFSTLKEPFIGQIVCWADPDYESKL